MSDPLYTYIRAIGTYYGGLAVKEDQGKYYWSIEDWTGDTIEFQPWQEISKTLYDELINTNNNKKALV